MIILPSTKDTFKIALRQDSALDMTQDEYNDYLKTCEESALKLKDGQEPTFFVIRKTLPYSLSKKVKSEQVSFSHGEAQVQLGYMLEEVRCSIVDIINPSNVSEDQKLKFVKAQDGGATEELVEGLDALGAVADIFAARQNVVNSKSQDLLKKK